VKNASEAQVGELVAVKIRKPDDVRWARRRAAGAASGRQRDGCR
jgi:hypothetical protein